MRDKIMRILENVKWGLAFGLWFAGCLSAIVLVQFVLRGSSVLAGYGITLSGIFARYFALGIACGACVGLLKPLARWRAGAIMIGVIGAFFVYVGVGMLIQGPLSTWSRSDWGLATVLGCVLGVTTGNWSWEQFVYPTLPPPKPHDSERPQKFKIWKG